MVTALRFALGAVRLEEHKLELYMGNMAWALQHGLDLDVGNLPLISHNRGSVVMGFCLVPIMWLLGPSLIAIKLLAALLSGATAAFFVRLLDRAGGRAAAWSGLALFALLPPAFLLVDTVLWGSHTEFLVIGFGALLFLLTRLEEPSIQRYACFGFICGFGVFFSLQFVLWMAPLMAAWFLVDRRFFLRPSALAFVACFIAALAPAALFLESADEATNVINVSLEDRLKLDDLAGAAERLTLFLTGEFEQSWLLGVHAGTWATWAFGLAVLLGGLLLVPRLLRMEPLAWFLALYPPLFLVAFAVSNFEFEADDVLDGMGARFVLPLLPCLAAWIALGVGELAKRRGMTAALLLLVPPLAAGAAATGALLAPPYASLPPVRGTEFSNFKNHIVHGAGDDPLERLEWIQRLDPDWPGFRPLAFRSIRYGSKVVKLDGLREIASKDPTLAAYMLVQQGRRAEDAGTALKLLSDAGWQELDPSHQAWFVRGIGESWAGRLWSALAITGKGRRATARKQATADLNRLQAPEQEWAAEGMGFVLGTRLTPFDSKTLSSLEVLGPALPKASRAAFYRGLGWGYRMRFFEGSYFPPSNLGIEHALEEADLLAFQVGLGWGRSVDESRWTRPEQ